MQQKKTITILVLLMALAAIVATSAGIFSSAGPGHYAHTSIRGKTVIIHGNGLYRDMSAEVAPQGIAQDYVTLFIGVPLLLLTLFAARRGGLASRLLLAGVLAYFLVTYLFYLVMGMYNPLFLVYVSLAGASFFAFVLTLRSFNLNSLPQAFPPATPASIAGRFLIFIALAIALLWLSIVVPPLLNGSIIPVQVEHYTTLIVQGLDLAILLPAAVVSGRLLIRKAPLGYLLGPVYFVFLSLLMTALTAKIVAMGMLGYNIIPAVFIIPAFNLAALACSFLLLRSVSGGGRINAANPLT